jgi:protein-S-isoprenylcysteine O-methyltransferase Ste14
MFSFSHLAVVAVVVSVTVIAWKFERKKPKAGYSRAAPSSIQRQVLKLAVLVVLFLGALAPSFSDDEIARYVHMVCTTGLAALAYLWMFQKGDK